MLAVWLAIFGVATTWAPLDRAAAEVSVSQATDSAQIIIRFRADPGGSSGALDAASRLLGDNVVASASPVGVSGAYLLTLSDSTGLNAALERLGQSFDVVYAEPNGVVSVPEAPGQFLDEAGTPAGNWGIAKVDAPAAWPLTGGAGVVVAVLDSGVDASHPDLAGRVLPGWNFVSNNDNTMDDSGHGTFVAGIIAGGPGGRVTGVAPQAKILPVKVLDGEDAGSTANFVAGIIYAVDHGARVINISASGISASQSLFDALQYAESHGVVVVAAAGNTADGQYRYPAAVPTVLAVSASTHDDTVAAFSSFGPFVSLAAPGLDVESTWWSAQSGDDYLTADGTSSSAPFAAGAAALVAAANPTLTAAQIRQILEETAVDIGAPGIDPASGHGRIDAALATRLAMPVQSAETGRIALDGDGAEPHLHFSADQFSADESVAVWATDAAGVHHVFRGQAADGQGNLDVDLGLLSSFPLGSVSVTAISTAGVAATATETFVSAPVAAAFEPVPESPSTPDSTYFPQTGHRLSLGFKAYWESHGGLAVFGYPISEEFTERNADTGQEYTVQYFERNRFEWHPELKGTPYEISLGRLGVELADQTYPAPAAGAGPAGARSFPETGHTLDGAFLDYWSASGGVTIFGYPISEPFEEGGHLVQYFERARFEYHPELAPQYQVLVSRFGVDLARQRGYLR